MLGIQLHRRYFEALPQHQGPTIAWNTVIINLGGVYAGFVYCLRRRVRCSSMAGVWN
jgi:hypothetical protein